MTGRPGAAYPPVMDDLLERALEDGPRLRSRVEAFLGPAPRNVPDFWEPGVGEIRYISVPGAEIRVIRVRPDHPRVRPDHPRVRPDHPRVRPERPEALRPVVLVPGWGTTPEGFRGFYGPLHGKAELYYIETREKNSSRIRGRRPEMSPVRSALDIRTALDAAGLTGGDYILAGTCWGSALILEGMIRGCLDPPTALLADPMHTLWFNKAFLRWISPWIPAFAIRAVRPLLRQALVGDLKDGAQKQRTFDFIDGADVWKWKKSAEAAWDFELFGRLGAVKREVFVLNGTGDKVHDPRNYPRVAAELPGGRFLRMPLDEAYREGMFGAVALEFARVGAGDGLPAGLTEFERAVR